MRILGLALADPGYFMSMGFPEDEDEVVDGLALSGREIQPTGVLRSGALSNKWAVIDVHGVVHSEGGH